MTRISTRRAPYWLPATCLCLTAALRPLTVVAQDVGVDDADARPQLSLSLGAGQSSNLTRTPIPIRSDVKALGVELGASTNSRRFEGRVDSNIQYRQYGTELIAEDDDVLGSFDGALVVQAVPERLSWSFEQNFGQVRNGPLAPASPDNRGNVRIFSTGPRVNLPVGDRNTLELGARISERRYDDADLLDGRLETTRIGFDRALDTVTRLGVVFERMRNELDGTSFSAYQFNIASVSYGREFSSGGVYVSIGSGEVELGDQTESTGVTRFEWSRGLGARSNLRVWAGRELTDAGELFRLGGLQRGGDALTGFANTLDVNDDRLSGVVLSADPLRRSTAGVTLDLVGRRLSVAVTLSAGDDRFEQNQTFDNQFDMLYFSLSRPIGRRWDASANFSVMSQDFEGLDQDNEDALARLALTRSLGRQTSLALSFDRSRRDSGISVFDEDFYMVSLAYAL